ncbi:MAG: MMPL family transporter [Deltaproteobacteria bacterium]|nr:MMPL family transporter [Deltaproteobacteria bacterium]
MAPKTQDSPVEQFFRNMTAKILEHRLLTLTALAIISGVFISGFPQITINNSNSQWFEDSDPTITRYEKFQEYYGTDKFIYLLLDTPGGKAFSPETLSQLRDIESMLRTITFKDAEVFEEVVHIANVKFIDGDASGIEVIELADGLGQSEEDLQLFQERAESNPNYEGLLFSPDKNAVGILAEVRVVMDDDKYHTAIVTELRKNLNQAPFKDSSIHIGGGPIVDTEMDALTIGESQLFGVLAAILNMLVTLFLFRRWPGVVIPMLTVALTIGWTFGLIGFGGQPLGVVHVMLPMMLLVVGVSDSVHILSEYQREYTHVNNRREAILNTMAEVSLPCLLTSLTTTAGMLSLSLAPIPPIRTMGIYAAVGVIFAYIISVFLVPVVLSYTGLESSQAKNSDRFEGILASISSFTTRRAKIITAATAVLIGLSIWGATYINIESNFMESFKKDSQIRISASHIDSTLGGTASLQGMIDTGKEGGAKEPEFLRKLEEFENYLAESESVVKVVSMTSLVKELNQVMMDGAPEEYRIPDNRNIIAQELMLYENSDPDGLFKMVTDDYQMVRLDVKTKSGGTHQASLMMEDAAEKFEELFGDTATLQYSGISHLFVRMTENLSRGQIYSYGAAFIMVFIMMIAVLKSFKLGLLSMIPNLLPILVTLGLMGFLKINLDFITLLIACIAIGIAVDDTIHFLVRFKREFEKSGDYETASRRTLQSSGRAMLFTTLILCGGFLMFLPSKMVSIALFGGLVAFTVFMALVSDFIILPAILELTRPLGAVNRGQTQSVENAPDTSSSGPLNFSAQIEAAKS